MLRFQQKGVIMAPKNTTLKREDLEHIFEEQGIIETTCEFCNTKYEFKKEDVLN